MTLKNLINILESQPKEKAVKLGFYNPHSHRGSYDQLAFEPCENITVEQMLDSAKSAIGNTYVGWKGGDFFMEENTDVFIAKIGHSGEEIGEILLNYMLDLY